MASLSKISILFVWGQTYKYSRTSTIQPSIIQISGLTEPKPCLPKYKAPSSVSDNTGFYTFSETNNSRAL